jgi:hypothetical protein
MKASVLACLLAGLTAATTAAIAQNAQTLSDGKAFAESVAPQSAGQIVNPAGVNPSAWSGGSAAMPSTTPSGLGAFSSPLRDSPLYGTARAQGALSGLGNGRILSCKNYVPTGDPIADQECAAVKFMNKDCVALTNSQAQVLGAAGGSSPNGAGCSGTYGAGMSNFGFQNQITAGDPVFHLSQTAQNNATAATDSNCVSTPVITRPAEYDTNTCSKTVSTDVKVCSQELAVAVTTSYTQAQTTYTCDGGVLQGRYCVSTSSSPATASYSCPDGGTLNGQSCASQTSIPATPYYTCASGELNGQTCVSQTSMPATPYYTCASGELNGQSCITSSTAVGVSSCPPPQWSFTPASIWTLTRDANNNAWCSHVANDPADPIGSNWYLASTSYSCPNGGTLSGNTCTTTTTATLNYKCDSGTLSGSSCITGETTPASVNYKCDSGTLSGSSCITDATVPASVTYTCASGTLSGSQCVASTSTPASLHYSCPGGAMPVGDQCITYSTQVSWIDNCTPYEQSAGARLGDPK